MQLFPPEAGTWRDGVVNIGMGLFKFALLIIIVTQIVLPIIVLPILRKILSVLHELPH